MTVLLAIFFIQSVIIPSERCVDWMANPPGVSGGIPIRTIGVTVSADTNGLVDARSTIQAAINATPVGTCTYLPPGRYWISGHLDLKSQTTLKGAGPVLTTLVYSNVANPTVYELNAGDTTLGVSQNVIGGNTKGSTNLTVGSTNGIYIGATVLIDQTNDPALLGGSIEGYTYLSRNNGTRLMGQLVEVLSMVSDGFTFTPPLAYAYSLGAQATPVTITIENAGVEDLCLTNAMSTEPLDGGGRLLNLYQAKDCWLKNCSFHKCIQYHVFIWRSLRCTVRDCDFSEGTTYTSVRCYGVDLLNQSTACLVENNWTWRVRTPYVLEGAGPWNIYGYNFCTAMTNAEEGMISSFLPNHGGAPHMNLFEGNVGTRASADLFHAGSCYNTIFRNWCKGWEPNATVIGTNMYHRAIQVAATNYYYNVVGNILGTPAYYRSWSYEATTNDISNSLPYIYRDGFVGSGESIVDYDTNTINSLIRHGNYDYATDSTIWDDGISDHAIPASLYLPSKPPWFWKSMDWPPIGPDVTRCLSGAITNSVLIPAQARYLGLYPVNLQVSNLFIRTP